MIGIGKWKFNVSIPFVQINPIVIIEDNDGEYALTVSMGGVNAAPSMSIIDIQEFDNALSFKISTSMFKLYGDISATIYFEDNTCEGVLDAPMLGMITVQGKRVKGR